MNTLQSIESIQQIFPNLSRNQIRLDLDIAQKLLASETGEIKTRASLSNISTNFAWALPSGFIGIEDLVFYDSDNNPKYPSDFHYKYEIELGKLFIFTTESTPITGLDSSISSAYIHYRELPATLTTESTSMEMAEQFRDACESYVFGKYFAKFPVEMFSNGQIIKALNIQAAQLHKNEYEKLRLKLKKYLGSQIKTSGEAQYYQHAGAQVLPRRPNDSTSGTTVSIAALSDLYAKYAYYKITPALSDPVLPTIQINYDTIACSISGDSIILTSTGDFDAETIINFSNQDCTYTYDSSSQITITAPSGWTNASFEIYERD